MIDDRPGEDMIEYPEMREWVMDVLRTLANPEYQRRAWVDERERDPADMETLYANLSLLYDESGVADSPEEAIGTILRNGEEARALRALDQALTPVLDSLPPGTEDAEVIDLPAWQDVVAAAADALAVLAKSDVGLL